MKRSQAPINQEWYKSHKWKDPDYLEQQYLKGFGEFGINFAMSFEKHLKEMRVRGT